MCTPGRGLGRRFHICAVRFAQSQMSVEPKSFIRFGSPCVFASLSHKCPSNQSRLFVLVLLVSSLRSVTNVRRTKVVYSFWFSLCLRFAQSQMSVEPKLAHLGLCAGKVHDARVPLDLAVESNAAPRELTRSARVVDRDLRFVLLHRIKLAS